MIYVYYTRFSNRLSIESYDHFFQQLQPGVQNKIFNFRNWQDGQRCLLGNALLINGLKSLGLIEYSLHNIKLTEFQRPYFADGPDFNISHSGEYVICAISQNSKVGIDIEEIKSIELDDFKTQFSENEWQEILQSSNNLYSFYNTWTKKEAFVKAIGKGLSVPLKNIEIVDNRISWDDKEWFLHKIQLAGSYVSHLVCDMPLPEIIVEKLNFY